MQTHVEVATDHHIMLRCVFTVHTYKHLNDIVHLKGSLFFVKDFHKGCTNLRKQQRPLFIYLYMIYVYVNI